MKPFLIVANWKMNPDAVSAAARLARAEDEVAHIVLPPAVFLDRVAAELAVSDFGAQDVSLPSDQHLPGRTGSISARMLASLGARYVLVGHSERRAMGDTDAIVREKVRTATRAGLRVILCIGEPLAIRRKGMAATRQFIKQQIAQSLKGITTKNLIIAYEPVWAIGSGKADTPEFAGEIAEFIQKLSVVPKNTPILYGGSVVPENAKAFGVLPVLSGFLVGGASLNPAKLKAIRKAVSLRYETGR